MSLHAHRCVTHWSAQLYNFWVLLFNNLGGVGICHAFLAFQCHAVTSFALGESGVHARSLNVLLNFAEL